MDEAQMQMRNLKDFLLVYNAMSEHCFVRCVSNLNFRGLTADEESCVSHCAARGVRSSHRIMTSYMTMMPAIVERRTEEQRAALLTAGPDDDAANSQGNSETGIPTGIPAETDSGKDAGHSAESSSENPTGNFVGNSEGNSTGNSAGAGS